MAKTLGDTKGKIRSRKQKDRTYNGEKLGNTKGVIKTRNTKYGV
jgi:hypothetical protein